MRDLITEDKEVKGRFGTASGKDLSFKEYVHLSCYLIAFFICYLAMVVRRLHHLSLQVRIRSDCAAVLIKNCSLLQHSITTRLNFKISLNQFMKSLYIIDSNPIESFLHYPGLVHLYNTMYGG